jgi:glyoxylase-like metal-dependent hydrolase (beta-lactamase superfamily II)
MSDLPRLEQTVRWLNKPVGLVMPSHLHFDHILGLDRAALHFGAKIGLGSLAHAHVSAQRPLRFVQSWKIKLVILGWLVEGMPLPAMDDWKHGFRFGLPKSKNPFMAPLCDPLHDGDAVPYIPGWELLETPGHSDDEIALYHRQGGFLILGDTICNFTGGAWNCLLTDVPAYQKTVSRLKQLEVQALFPAHGQVLTGDNVIETIVDS